MQIYNTLTAKKEVLQKPAEGPLNLFVCGITVYDYPHIGNMRTYVAFDIFARYLRERGYPLFYLQNVTDIDDKIIRRAKEDKVSPFVVARKFETVYHKNEKLLKINSVDKYARATNYIPEIIKQIKTLVAKGHAYKIENDGYYFDIATFPDYGKLSHRTAEGAEDAVTRIDESVNKRNKGDFALWKLTGQASELRVAGNKKQIVVDGEPLWNAELGWGRPGWHIEDTAITEKFFGPQYDIHGGAVDLKFPHHEAEIAQQESASGKKPLAKLWVHTGFLLVNGEKMSKSKGNFVTMDDFLKKYLAGTFRFMVASHHYRSPMNYTLALADQSQNSIQTIKEFLAKLGLAIAKGGTKSGSSTLLADIEKMKNDFYAAMDDDLNTPLALSTIFAFINVNQKYAFSFSKEEAHFAEQSMTALIKVLGIEIVMPKIPIAIKKLAQQRDAMRARQQFGAADAVRKKMENLGYAIDDTPLGALVMKK